MWSITNNTPFAAKGAIRLDPKTSRKFWLVAVKSTFNIQNNGTLSLAEEQQEVFEDPIYRAEEEGSSLLYDSDLMGPKQNVDILLNGTAYQPGGISKTKLVVGLSLGSWDKTLKIVGDRLWDRFLGVTLQSYTQPFSKMAICYERAYGGSDEKAAEEFQHYYGNTVGRGYASKKKRLYGKPLPNIEYEDHPTKPNYKKNKSAGFGPILNYWNPRSRYAGTYDEDWEKSRAPLFPLDFSQLFFQSSPPDQQVVCVSGGEKVVLYNLMPNNPQFSFYLPEIKIDFATEIGSNMTQHQAEIKTIIIEPDIPRLIMVWQGKIDCHNADHLVEGSYIEYLNNNKAIYPDAGNTAAVKTLLNTNS